MKIEMTYEEFLKLQGEAKKSQEELTLYKRAIERLYGKPALDTLLSEYERANHQDDRAKLYKLFNSGKL